MSPLASLFIARRTFVRIRRARSLSQSWMMGLSRYASWPRGTDSKKLPPTNPPRSPSPPPERARGVGAGSRFEEVSAHELAASAEPRLREGPARGVAEARQIEDRSSQVRARAQQAGEQRAIASAHVGERAQRGKVVRLRH